MRPAVLLVDDDPLAARAMTRVLEAAGYAVTPVASAASARLAIAEHEHTAWIVDQLLPDGLGMEAVVARARGAGRATPVLVITGERGFELVDRATQLVGVQIAFKPFSTVVVRRFLAYALRTGGLVGTAHRYCREKGLEGKGLEVVLEMCRGTMRRDVDVALGVAPSTIDSHVRGLIRRAGARDMEDVMSDILRRHADEMGPVMLEEAAFDERIEPAAPRATGSRSVRTGAR